MISKGKQPKGSGGIFRNPARIDTLHEAIRAGDRAKLEDIVNDRGMNAPASKRLKGKDVTWETLLEDTVFQVQDPNSAESVVVKLFVDLPFHEICGNVIATKLIETAGPFFVRCLDVGRFTDTAASFFIVMEYVPNDTEGITKCCLF